MNGQEEDEVIEITIHLLSKGLAISVISESLNEKYYVSFYIDGFWQG